MVWGRRRRGQQASAAGGTFVLATPPVEFVGVWPARAARAGLRGVRARWRVATTRTSRSRRGCCRRAMRPHVAAVYAFARTLTTSPTRARAGGGAAGPPATTGSSGCMRAAHAAGPASTASHARRADRRRRRPVDSLARSAGRAVRRSAERVRSGYHDDPLRLVGRPARLLPPLGQPDRAAGAADRRLSRRRAGPIVRRAVHRAAVDQLLAGLRPRLAPGRLYVPREVLDRHAARAKPICRARCCRCPGGARCSSASQCTPRAFEDGRRVCDALRGRLRFELRLTWLGGRRILDAVAADPRRLLERRPSLGAATCRSCCGEPSAGEAQWPDGRKTSFYYSFLVLPADQRRAIIAVWDFCRAVDDAVDEPAGWAADKGEAVAFWRDELARCYEGAGRRPRRACSCSRSSPASTCRDGRSRT